MHKVCTKPNCPAQHPNAKPRVGDQAEIFSISMKDFYYDLRYGHRNKEAALCLGFYSTVITAESPQKQFIDCTYCKAHASS